ncbi:hypothetical protein UCREL1_10215 [Eutypa lata UCREL1]|uniref:Uncharacterized protein n=1 Tax=Eutypa lata (strain UCR-EL1) TaxID=1287681 RepID=M7T864_EUTLA|nr:hypothetical protein UCREL1_10215 [Eutypa lata UCREL1]
MYFTGIFASALVATASAATIQHQHQQQASALSARQFEGGTCTFEMEQFKPSPEKIEHFTGRGLDGSGEPISFFDMDFEYGGYPVVMRGFPEFFLVVKKDDDDVAPVQYQYLAQKWASDDTEWCSQTAVMEMGDLPVED